MFKKGHILPERLSEIGRSEREIITIVSALPQVFRSLSSLASSFTTYDWLV